MPKNRIIGEEYWSHFIEMDNKTNRMKHNGHEFEKLLNFVFVFSLIGE